MPCIAKTKDAYFDIDIPVRISVCDDDIAIDTASTRNTEYEKKYYNNLIDYSHGVAGSIINIRLKLNELDKP